MTIIEHSAEAAEWDSLPLTREHAEKLAAAAISPVVAKEKGLRSITSADELPDWASWAGEKAVPCIVFPWITIDGEVTEQLRPDAEFEHNGEGYKYLFPKGAGAVLNALRHDEAADRVLIVEGTKQGLAAASWAPEGVAVYGVGGCRNWSSDGIPDSDLEVCEGRRVFVCLDADVSQNRDVYDAAMKLGQAARAEGAAKVSYVRLPAGGTNGLDDVLGKKKADRRTSFIDNLLAQAHPSKPCDAKPKPKDKRPAVGDGAGMRVAAAGDGGERSVIYVDGDRFEVINDITRVLLDRWDATRLFQHGELISQLVNQGEGPKMKPLLETDGSFFDVLQETSATAGRILNADGEQIGIRYTWPDGQTIKAARSRYARFSKLEVIARSPFVRVDGSICQRNGYDATSRTMVVMDDALAAIQVPEFPSREEVEAAVTLILDTWLGDFPFPDQENRANVLALVLTPFVRALMDVVPLAVVDAHTPGTGKNLLVDCILLMFLGERPQLLPFNRDDDEFRKTLTSAFREGSEVFVFDEAHHLEGASLARALTASHWKDRALGVNQMLGFPNRMTWVSLGNNVRVEGDIFRRVYRVALRSEHEHPEDRPASDFRHEDLKSWTLENRPALLRAALTIVRAWFAAGQPKPTNGTAFGGFEKFARTLGGILQTAGVEGFLGNLVAWRSESNFSSGYWESHLRWLIGQFGASEFTASAVRSKLVGTTDPAFPPIKGDPEDKAGYPKTLGEAYAKQRDRSYGGLRLRRPVDADGKPRRDGTGRALWVVEPPADGDPGEKGRSRPVSPDEEGEKRRSRPVSPDESSETSETPSSHLYAGEKTFFTGDHGASAEKTKTCATEAAAGSLGGLRGPGNLEEAAEVGQSTPAQRQNSDNDVPKNRQNSGTTAESGLSASEEPWDGVEQPSLFGPAADPAPETAGPGAVDLATWTAEGDVELPEGVLVFDIESTGSDLWPVREGFIRITGVQQGRTIRVYDDAAQVAQLLREAKLIVGHNLMGFDLIAFALHHGVDIHELAEQGRLVDTMLTEVVVNPPEARTKQGQIMRSLGLDALGTAKQLGAKSHDLKALAAKHGGFDQIPATDPDYVAYCAQDVNLTARIAQTQHRTAYAKREHRIAAIGAQIRMNGFRVDVELNARRLAEGEALRAERLNQLQERYGLPMTLPNGKPAKSPHATKEGKAAIERAFNDLGVELGRTKSGGPAFGKEAREEMVERYADRPDVLELLDTVGSLLGIRTVYGTVERCLIGDRVHPDITMFQASGRWSITEPGLTVMGKRGGKYVEREIYLPEPGHVLISADLSQVDARTVAAWCQDPAYMELFEPGRDSHTEIALAVWGDAGRRDDAKVLGHGWNYGMGIAKLAAKIGDEDTAREFDRAMKERYPGLVAWKQDVAAMADSGELLDNGFGRRLRTTPSFGWTQGPALMGQSAARDILMHGLLRMPRELYPYLRAVVHDEVVMSIPADQADEIEAQVMEALSFSWAPREDYRPVQIEAGLAKRGQNWGACYAK